MSALKSRAFGALLVLLAGLAGALFLAAQRDANMRQELLRDTRLIEQALDYRAVQSLTGTSADLDSPVYQRLKAQVVLTRTLFSRCRFINLIGRRPVDRPAAAQPRAPLPLCYLADSEPPDSDAYSPPGQLLLSEPERDLQFDDAPFERIIGPRRDAWGCWVSSYVSISDPVTHATVAALGMDIDARDWNLSLVRAAQPPLLATVALLAVWLARAAFLRRQKRAVAGEGERFGRADIAAISACGLVLSALAAYCAHENESQHRTEAFQTLAASKTASLAATLRQIGEVQLEGLASFMSLTGDISACAFQTYAAYLAQSPLVQAWLWAPAVEDAERDAFERAARQGGLPMFGIWRQDTALPPFEPEEAKRCYPVYCVAPLAGNERAVGFDLGSDPVRRFALLQAEKTGLTTATAPLVLVQEPGQQKGLVVCKPVYSRAQPRAVRGFALAALKLETVLASAGPDDACSVSWSLVREDGSFEDLAEGPSFPAPCAKGLSASRPILAFGHLFNATARAERAFTDSYPMRAGGRTLFAGLALTAVAAYLSGQSFRRRKHFERLLSERTSELQRSESQHRAMFEKNRSIQLIVAVKDGRILNANPAACAFYGYPLEALKTLSIVDINVAPREQVLTRLAAAQCGKLYDFTVQHRLADGSVRDVEVHACPIPINGQIQFYSIIHDITERKLVERKLAHILNIRTEEWKKATAAALDASEEEARRIGRELHDTLCQDLIGISRQSESLTYSLAPHEGQGGSGLADKLQWLATQAAAAARRARELSHLLAVSEPADEPLEDVLRGSLMQLQNLYGVAYDLDLDDALPAFSQAQRGHLVRIVRESYVNAARHAHAQHVWVDGLRKDDAVVFSISNDGDLLTSPHSWKEGLGLRQMRMRAHLLSAELRLFVNNSCCTVQLTMKGGEAP